VFAKPLEDADQINLYQSVHAHHRFADASAKEAVADGLDGDE